MAKVVLDEKAVAEANRSVGDEARKHDPTELVQADVEVDADEKSSFRVWRDLRDDDWAERLRHVRPTVNAAKDRRTEI